MMTGIVDRRKGISCLEESCPASRPTPDVRIKFV